MSFCTTCGAELKQDEKFCTNCGVSATGESLTKHTPNYPTSTIEGTYKFKTLLGYGKFISGFGWLMILLGIGGVLMPLLGLVFTGGTTILLLGCFALIAFGLPFIISGQLISCFVEIEKNTRLTYQFLKNQH